MDIVKRLRAWQGGKWPRDDSIDDCMDEAADTIERLRKLVPGCDCNDPGQCWEPCGTLGHSAKHARVVKE